MPLKDNLDRIESLTNSLELLSESFDLYILFIDLCESTNIKQYCLDNQLPDSFWITRQRIFLGRTAAIIKEHQGNIIKTIGDEVMATFPPDCEAEQIVRCCIRVFQSFQGLKTYDKGRFVIRVKASIDFGTCYDGSIDDSKPSDPIGTCVDRCARLNHLAKPDQIIFSTDFKDALLQTLINKTKYQLATASAIVPGLGDTTYFTIEV
jgi:class 3 adenylate cyclase